MIIAVDFDNTLAMGNASHITLLEPNRVLIERLKAIKATINPTIKIVTARGAKAGLSRKEKAKRYSKLITDWLDANGVPYDSISFNKEYFNLGIDDQVIHPDAFFTGEISEFTRNRIILTDTTVIKCCKTALFEHEWYKRARLLDFDVPQVLFCNDECIITEQIMDYRKPTAAELIELLNGFQYLGHENAPYQTYVDNVPNIESMTDKARAIVAGLPGLEHKGTFFHGDLSTTNVLCVGNTPYLIDPNCKHIFGSYLTDAGKAVFSLIAYEAQFQEAQKIVDHFGPDVWRFAVSEGLRVCKYQPKYISIVNNIADLI